MVLVSFSRLAKQLSRAVACCYEWRVEVDGQASPCNETGMAIASGLGVGGGQFAIRACRQSQKANGARAACIKLTRPDP
eukprot:15436812-Alexandrium_andersonii.AAC.1